MKRARNNKETKMERMLSTCCNMPTVSNIWNEELRKVVKTPEPVCSRCCVPSQTVAVPVDIEAEEAARSYRGFGSGWSSYSEWRNFKYNELAYELRDER